MLIPHAFHSFWNQHSAMTTTLPFKRNTYILVSIDLLAFLYLIYIICHNSITLISYFKEKHANIRWNDLVQDYCGRKNKQTNKQTYFLCFLDCTKSIWKYAGLQYYYRKPRLLWFEMSSSRKKSEFIIHEPNAHAG